MNVRNFKHILGSSPRGIPRHFREERESEERFHLLPIVEIEPFPEREMEWDYNGATLCPM